MTAPDPAHADPYVYPGTRVLINYYDIRDPIELAQVADDISTQTIHRLVENPIPGNFDLNHLQRIHRAVWGELYPWAGEIRTVGIAKDGITFCPSRDITSTAEETFGRLASEDHLRGLEPDPFIERLTGHHKSINYLHPFREGNGRAQRVFLGQLADHAGYHIAWERLDPVVNDYASYQQAARNLHEPMRQIFTELLDDRRPDTTADATRQAARLHQLAADIRADASLHRGIAEHLGALAARGEGPHVSDLRQYRANLDQQVRAIGDLDNAALGHTQLSLDQTFRLDLTAGPEPGRTQVLEEHRVLTATWDQLHASNQTLDELAAERPADLARRQHLRADLVTQRATGLEATARAATVEAAAHRLRTARSALQHPDGQATPAPSDPGVDPEPTRVGDAMPPMPPPAQLPHTEMPAELTTPANSEAFTEDGAGA